MRKRTKTILIGTVASMMMLGCTNYSTSDPVSSFTDQTIVSEPDISVVDIIPVESSLVKETSIAYNMECKKKLKGHLSINLDEKKSSTTNQMDIPVFAPENISVAEITLKEIEFEDCFIINLTDVLFQNHIGYVGSEIAMTKGTASLIVEDLKTQLETGNIDPKYDTKDDVQREINELEKMMAALPNEYVLKPLDISWFDLKNRNELFVCATLDHSLISELTVIDSDQIFRERMMYLRNSSDSFWTSQMLQTRGDQYDAIYWLPEEVNQELADYGQEAQKLLYDIGLSGYSCNGVRLFENEKKEQVREFVFSKTVRDMQVSYVDLWYSYETVIQEEKTVPPLETIRVWVDAQGILMFLWERPTTITSTNIETVDLIDNSHLTKVIEQIACESLIAGNISEFHPSRVELSYMQIYNPDQTGTYKLIPVWDLYGTYIDNHTQELIGSGGFTSVFTINAVTGERVYRQEMKKSP